MLGGGCKCWQLGPALLWGLRCCWVEEASPLLLESKGRRLGESTANAQAGVSLQGSSSNGAAKQPSLHPGGICMLPHPVRVAAISTMWPRGLSLLPEVSVSFAVKSPLSIQTKAGEAALS